MLLVASDNYHFKNQHHDDAVLLLQYCQ